MIAACGHRQAMNKSGAEKALRVFDSELLGTVVGIMQTEGWVVFSGLLTSDSIPDTGNIRISGKTPINLSLATGIFPAAFLKLPLNFNQEYFKNGKQVCAVNYYYKTNPDSSFYIKKAIFIKPCSLEIRCFYITDKKHHCGRINIVVSGRDSAGSFMEGRIRGRLLTGDKGIIQAEDLHAEIKLFDLFFSVNADFPRMKPNSHEIWTDYIRFCDIKVSDYLSGRYIGRFETPEKNNLQNNNLVFVFSDGSKEPASACFSSYSLLKSKD